MNVLSLIITFSIAFIVIIFYNPTLVKGQIDSKLFEEKRMYLKFEFPSTWTALGIYEPSEKADCSQELCLIIFHPPENELESDASLTIVTTPPSESEGITSVLDYAKDQYLKQLNPTYLNDNQTIIDNHTAIQIQYLQYGDDPSLLILTKHNDLFYYIIYSSDDLENDFEMKQKVFNLYLDDVKKILNSIRFEGNYTSEKIPDEIVPYFTNMAISKERGFPTFVNSTQIDEYEFQSNMRTLESMADNNLIDKQLLETIKSGIENGAIDKKYIIDIFNRNFSTADIAEITPDSIIESTSDSLTITSQTSYIDSLDFYHVVGEVQYNSVMPVDFVQIIGTFYDKDGNVVGTATTYTNPSTLDSGDTAPFDLILTSSSVPMHEISNYKLSVTSQ